MSGGRWGYMQYRLEEDAERMARILKAVARTEHIVDWAVCGDTGQEEAGRALLTLWADTFDLVVAS